MRETCLHCSQHYTRLLNCVAKIRDIYMQSMDEICELYMCDARLVNNKTLAPGEKTSMLTAGNQWNSWFPSWAEYIQRRPPSGFADQLIAWKMQSGDRNGFVIEDGNSIRVDRAGKKHLWNQRPSNDPMKNFHESTVKHPTLSLKMALKVYYRSRILYQN